jgi:xanthine dehydrogenase accessory factor
MKIGWKTTVIDHRKASLNQQLFPFTDHVIHVKISEWNKFELSSFDSAIIMSHQFEKDREYLRHLNCSLVEYIGLLGPSKRRDKLLDDCGIDF